MSANLTHIISVISTNLDNLEIIKTEIKNFTQESEKILKQFKRDPENLENAQMEVDNNFNRLNTIKEGIEDEILKNYKIYNKIYNKIYILRKRNLIASRTFTRN